MVQGDIQTTRTHVEALIQKANPSNGDFVVLQEMSDTGWSMDYKTLAKSSSVKWGCSLAKQFGVWLQIGWAGLDQGRGKNCISICSPEGAEVATYIKTFTCNPLEENKLYVSGSELIILHIGELRICPFICYDLRFPELWRLAAFEGVDVFTESSSWPRARIHHWKPLITARAIENQAFVVSANRSGKDQLAEWGGASLLVSPLGEILAEAPETGDHALSTTIDTNNARAWRNSFPAMEDIREELLGNIKVTHIFA